MGAKKTNIDSKKAQLEHFLAGEGTGQELSRGRLRAILRNCFVMYPVGKD